MIIPLLAIGLLIGINQATKPPSFATPQELAQWAKCDPSKVAYYIGQKTEYKLQGKDWGTAEEAMAIGQADCKGKALIARDTLNSCVGYEARIAILKRGNTRHAITLFTDHNGNRGFINDIQSRTYPPNTDWNEVIDGIGGYTAEGE